MNHPETETPQQTQPENHAHSAKHKKTSKRELIRQRSIYALPNSFTLAALFAAFFAITQSMHGRYESAAISVFIAMLLDGMDGRIARFTNSQSAFGEQLDSLADMVSFGVAPALIVYNWQLYEFGKLGYCVAFIYCACAALRLALFNTLIGKVSKKWFIGIPSPTAAALMVGMIWLDRSYDGIFDQSSIWVLLLTLFYKHFPKLIEHGHIYVAQPPLFRVDINAQGKNKPARKLYALDQTELDSILERLHKENIKPSAYSISRFKGLGEMNPDQLKDTTLHPDTRRLLQVTIPDLERHDTENIFIKLMGKGEAASRRAWMEREGDQAELDI